MVQTRWATAGLKNGDFFVKFGLTYFVTIAWLKCRAPVMCITQKEIK
jgi:hypothetical protein